MMMLKSIVRPLLLLTILAAGNAQAALLCTVTTLPVTFPSYDSLSSASVDATGQITVTCIGLLFDISYNITLSSGGSGSFSPRQMSQGSDRLNYNLYSDSSRTAVWGDSAANWVSDTYTTLIIGGKNYPVYGRLPGSQHVPAGVYQDSVVVTVFY